MKFIFTYKELQSEGLLQNLLELRGIYPYIPPGSDYEAETELTQFEAYRLGFPVSNPGVIVKTALQEFEEMNFKHDDTAKAGYTMMAFHLREKIESWEKEYKNRNNRDIYDADLVLLITDYIDDVIKMNYTNKPVIAQW